MQSLDSLFGLAGRNALVTGGARGIGRAACLAYARAGAAVAVHYRKDGGPAGEVVAEIEDFGGHAVAVGADVAVAAEVERMALAVAEFCGDAGLHILLNNAGIYPAGSLETLTVEEWDHVMAVNARGPFLVTKAALPLLKMPGRARVINIGTVMGHRAVPGVLHYVSSKGAVIGFTRGLARELAPYGITVNCAAPSMVGTDTANRDFGDAREAVVADQAIPRYEQPEDFVGLLLFLASDASGFTTGQTILADGGRVFL